MPLEMGFSVKPLFETTQEGGFANHPFKGKRVIVPNHPIRIPLEIDLQYSPYLKPPKREVLQTIHSRERE